MTLARTALAAWKRQGHGGVAGPIADADIMELFKVGRSILPAATSQPS